MCKGALIVLTESLSDELREGEGPEAEQAVRLEQDAEENDKAIVEADSAENPDLSTAQPINKKSRADSMLSAALWVVSALLLAVVGWFGVTIYQTVVTNEGASPALRAVALLKDSVRSDPNNASTRIRLAEAMAAAGMLDEATSQLEQALKIDEGHSGAYLDLGLIATQQGDLSAAEGFFSKVIELTTGTEYEDLNQRREQAYFYLGQLAMEREDYEEAIKYLKGALRIRRDASDTYYALAAAYRGLDENDAAFEHVEIALAFDPNYADARYLAGRLLLEAGNEASASVEFRKAVSLAPDVVEFTDALEALGPWQARVEAAEAALESGDAETALAESLIAQSLAPEDTLVLLVHARALELTGEKQTAQQVYEAVIELEPENTEALEALERLTGTGQ